MATTKVQSIHGHHLLCEHFTSVDTNSGYPVSSFKLTKDSTITFTTLAVFLSCIIIPSTSLLAVYDIITILQALLLGVLTSVLCYVYMKSYTSESIIAVGGVGIQIVDEWWGGRVSSTFIPLSKVRDVIINEAIFRHSIMYYLALLTTDNSKTNTIKIIPLFTSHKPKLVTIRSIYKSLKSTLLLNQQ